MISKASVLVLAVNVALGGALLYDPEAALRAAGVPSASFALRCGGAALVAMALVLVFAWEADVSSRKHVLRAPMLFFGSVAALLALEVRPGTEWWLGTLLTGILASAGLALFVGVTQFEYTPRDGGEEEDDDDDSDTEPDNGRNTRPRYMDMRVNFAKKDE